jgi:hypothetical protein
MAMPMASKVTKATQIERMIFSLPEIQPLGICFEAEHKCDQKEIRRQNIVNINTCGILQIKTQKTSEEEIKKEKHYS